MRIPIGSIVAIAANVLCGITFDPPISYINWFGVGFLVGGEYYRGVVRRATEAVKLTIIEMHRFAEEIKRGSNGRL